ncbi:molecular chaperone [Mesorhizobium sp. NPDC059054]|uniref:fimbrial biogenesis chaperone n=1 Tax=Mesorhizobium sp. NPDC059054 TaxID=3346711 RepID=UPI003695F1EC
MHPLLKGLGGAVAFILSGMPLAHAASLRVAPTTVELIGPDSAATLNLRNEARGPLNVQVRVFRWTQQGGSEQLEPTSEVVASPPSMKLKPNEDYTIRVVRVDKTPVGSEESYRVVVDELPDPSRKKAGTVNLVVRHMVPVFFRNADAGGPEVTWKLTRSGRSLMLTGENKGGSRLRLADLTLTQGGKAIASRKGLVGYVLGGSVMQWPLGAAGRLGAGAVKLSAQSGAGPITASVATSR